MYFLPIEGTILGILSSRQKQLHGYFFFAFKYHMYLYETEAHRIKRLNRYIKVSPTFKMKMVRQSGQNKNG